MKKLPPGYWMFNKISPEGKRLYQPILGTGWTVALWRGQEYGLWNDAVQEAIDHDAKDRPSKAV